MCFRGVSGVFPGCFRVVSGVFPGVFPGCFRGVSGVFPGCFRCVSGCVSARSTQHAASSRHSTTPGHEATTVRHSTTPRPRHTGCRPPSSLHALETTRDAKRDRPSAFPTPDRLVELLFAQNSLRGGEIRKVYARTHRQSPPRILCFQLSTAGGSGEAAGKTYTGHTQEDLAGGAELGARDVNSRDVNSKTGSSRSKHPLPQASGGLISGMWAPCASVICFVSV